MRDLNHCRQAQCATGTELKLSNLELVIVVKSLVLGIHSILFNYSSSQRTHPIFFFFFTK